MSSKKWIVVVAGILACGAAAYVGFSKKAPLFSFLNKVPLVRGEKKSVARGGVESRDPLGQSLDLQPAPLPPAPSTADSLREVHSALRSVAEVQSINRANLEIQQQNKKEP